MTAGTLLPILLLTSTLLPLAAFVVVCLGASLPQLWGARVGANISSGLAKVSVAAIGTACVLSWFALLAVWIPAHGVAAAAHGVEHSEAEEAGTVPVHEVASHAAAPPAHYSDRIGIARFGELVIASSYYIDALTVVMFAVVTLVSLCVHVYSLGYMHEELHDVTDHEAHTNSGEALRRAGRFHRFFQYLSLFSFSMLGLVLSGNLFLVFVFWELVGICSYLLIGFYFERQSASTAANKAFIVNRIGDFGMLIGLMALWSSIGTLEFGDHAALPKSAGEAASAAEVLGLFSTLRPADQHHALTVPPAMVTEASRGQSELSAPEANRAGYWLLVVAGVGIFCGCVGKSAQFPLHVWLPDAMEGPTPVSALVHSATMVAAGVYLVGRCYPIFAPEVLLVIAVVGCITLALAATIAITATDIKRVLAYSTVSQLGYMMLALGLGGWMAGVFHLVTHALFKSLLFLCSGSVIHAVHSNDLREMGGLLRKMPTTAYTMLVGCLAIIGAGLPTLGIGLSGYYSKDAILEQAWSFGLANPSPAMQVLRWAPLVGAVMTAFYMFRMWFLAFLGEPRNHHRYDHAHESPPSMTRPLVLLAVLSVVAGWTLPLSGLSLVGVLGTAIPVGAADGGTGLLLPDLTIPAAELAHDEGIRRIVGWLAFGSAATGVLLAAIVYAWRWLDAEEIAQTLRPVHALLVRKWWFDELYHVLFVLPTKWIGGLAAQVDRYVLDGLIHAVAGLVGSVARLVDRLVDRKLVDGTLDGVAHRTFDLGQLLRHLQAGSLRRYVSLVVVGVMVLFVLVSVCWQYAWAH